VSDDGFVPDEDTAVRIAQAVLIPIDRGKPPIPGGTRISGELKDGTWTVRRVPASYGAKGNDVTILISKKEGCILDVTLGK
jgi:hypothetical protein